MTARRALGAVVCILLASHLLACRPRHGTEVRRLLSEGRTAPLETLTVDGVTRWGRSLAGGRDAPRTLSFRDVAPGALTAYVAVRGPIDGPTEARLVYRATDRTLAPGRPEERTCTVTWHEDAPAPGWRPCRIEIARGARKAEIVIAFTGGRETALLVSEIHGGAAARTRRPDVFVILVDTMRYDVMRPFPTEFALGTGFEDLGRDALVFERARSSSSWTRTAVATLLTGLRPQRHKVYGRLDVLADDIETLPEILRRHGYATMAWSTNPNVLPAWGFAQGFDRFADEQAGAWSHEKTDGTRVFARLREALDARDDDGPAFYYVHLMDAHAPYVPDPAILARIQGNPQVVQSFPRPFFRQGSKQWPAYQRYMGEILDLDAQIGAFVDDLRRRGRYDDALVLVVSDHGEEFLDHWGEYHGHTLFDELLRVPVLLKLPGTRRQVGRVRDAVGFEDFLPTVLDALDIPVPSSIDGQIIGRAPTRPQIATLYLDQHRLSAIVDEPWKLIVDHHTERAELYNLDRDPAERRNLIELRRDKADALHTLLDAAAAPEAQGWHVLACGGSTTSSVAFTILGAAGDVRTRGLEQDDALGAHDAGARTVEVTLSLPPTVKQREQLGVLVDQLVYDEDLLSLTAASADEGALALRAERPLRYVLGNGATVAEATHLDLHGLRDAARVRGSALIECPQPSTRLPFEHQVAVTVAAPPLRIWYVPGPETVGEQDVDPTVIERLKALGYTW